MKTEGVKVGRCQRIYLASVYATGRYYVEPVADYAYILESYHYIGNAPNRQDLLREHSCRIFLDSGAFSAFTLGTSVDIQAYARFIVENKDIVDVASVLDGIGDAQLTLDNQHRLEDLGATVLPCFHFGEDTKYLEHYLNNYDHITIGGMVPISNSQLRPWLDHLWSTYLTDSAGWPLVKVHGFGLTAMDLVRRYPWYSVDSSSWVQSGAFGHVALITDGGMIKTVTVSEQSPNVHDSNQHYDNMPPYVQDCLREDIEQYGYDIDTLRTDIRARKQHNAKVYAALGTRELFPYTTTTGDLFQ